MIRAFSALVGALVLAGPVSARASAGDVDRGFGNNGRVLVRESGAVTGMSLVDERRTLLTVQPTKGDQSRGDPFSVALSASGRVLDRTPAPRALALPAGFVVRASAVDGADRTVVVGAATPGEDRVLRFLADGALDGSYGNGGAVDLTFVAEPFIILVKPDGRAHVFGDTAHAVLDAAGRSQLDRTQSSVSYPRNQPGVIDAVGDGLGDTVVVAGRSVDDDPFVMRLRADGRLDSRFGEGGFAVLPGPWFIPGGVIQDRRGRLLLGGTTNRRALVQRLTARGRLDTTFADGGRAQIAPPRGLKGWNARFLALDARDRILVAGSGWTRDQDVGAFRPVIARLRAR